MGPANAKSSSLPPRDDAAARIFSRGRGSGDRGQRVRICRLRADAVNIVSADGGVQDQPGGTGGGRDVDCTSARYRAAWEFQREEREARMGGLGPGHKSERARLARLVNMAKARAARKREPLRWRSGLESRIIEQLVWQWWVESRVEAREVREAGHPPAGKPLAKASAGRPWAKQRVARFLDVSHTWVNKLVKRFEADPDRMRRRMAACGPASFEKLERAREETRRQRKFGWLRGPIRMRRVKWTLGGKAQRAVVWTHSEKRRREEARRGQQGPPSVSYADLPAWARGAV